MKNRILLLFLLLSVLLYGQNKSALNVKIGLGCLYYKNIDETFTPFAYAPRSLGPQLDVSYVLPVSSHLGVEAGISVARNNHFTIGYFPTGSVGLLQNQFTSISIPLHLRAYIIDQRLFVSGGGFVSDAVRIKNTYYDQFEVQKGIPQNYVPAYAKVLPQKDVFRQFNTGIDLGLGYTWKQNDHFGFIIEAQTRIGLVDLNNNTNLFSYYSTKEMVKTFTPALLFGFYYNFEPKPGS